MDPHLTTIVPWDKEYLPNEKEAYQQARIEGYFFPQIGNGKIGSLYEEELEAIASHPPNINLSRYKKIKEMNFEELKEKYPALVDIIGPSVTEEDLFYYATRGWIPEYDTINLKIDRWNQYEDLSNIGKNLLDKLYSNKKNYVNSSGHSLEPYIIAFDENMDNEAAIKSIAERIGIDLPYGTNAHDSFYEGMAELLENKR